MTHQHHTTPHHHHDTESATYKPIFLVFGYILAVTLLIDSVNAPFSLMRWMDHFMAAFFLLFSFFKLLDLSAFADSYSRYDIIAARWRPWARPANAD